MARDSRDRSEVSAARRSGPSRWIASAAVSGKTLPDNYGPGAVRDGGNATLMVREQVVDRIYPVLLRDAIATGTLPA